MSNAYKIGSEEIDLPIDDIDCWERYPKHRWVYDLSRLLDAQDIKWSPYATTTLKDNRINLVLDTKALVEYTPAHIYIKQPDGIPIQSEVFIIKGEIKYIRCFDADNKSCDIHGDAELRISAFVSMYFQKFTGIITVKTIDKEIHSIELRSTTDLHLESNANITKLIKKIYKRNSLIA